MRPLHRLASVAAAAACALPTAAQAAPAVATAPCPELQPDARCGHVDVPLDRSSPGGEQIPIGFVVLPRTAPAKPALEPVFVILGGPGEAASGATGIAARNFAGVRDRRDVVLVDYRGEGRSAAIDCPWVQHQETDSMEEVIDAAGACGAQLGGASDRYGAADVADDVDAVRAALGFARINLYGVSYGTVHVQAFALRHGEHLRAMILNGAVSPRDVAGSWMLGISNANAVAANVAIVCLRSPSCSRANHRPARTFAALAKRLRRHPVDGVAPDASGTPRRLHVDEGTLVRIATAWDPFYSNDGELVAAARALRHGDTAPLLRLAAGVQGPLVSDAGDPAVFSLGANAATSCTDFPVPWDLSASLADRRAQYEAAMARIRFGPFSPLVWANNGGFSAWCLKWPAPDHVTPVFTPDARFPDVPALVVGATLDTPTTLAQTRFVARELPRSRLVVLRNAGHPPGTFASCMPDIYARFFGTLRTGDTSCIRREDADRPAVGTFSRRAGDAPPAERRPGDDSRIAERRAATVVWDTVKDALRQSWRLPDQTAGTGTGLRGGGFDETFDFDQDLQRLQLHRLRFSDDIAVDGQVTVDGGDLSATVTVTLDRRPYGSIDLSGRWFTFTTPAGPIRIDGRLGGRRIALLTPGG
jgi:pimeloyl-ACP methyl ester carboxylesterase